MSHQNPLCGGGANKWGGVLKWVDDFFQLTEYGIVQSIQKFKVCTTEQKNVCVWIRPAQHICEPCRNHPPQWPPPRYNIPTLDQSEA